MALQVFYSGDGCRIAHSGPLVVMCLNGATTVEHLETVSRCQDLVTQTHPRIVGMTVMSVGYLSTNQAVMQKGDELAQRFHGKVAGSIIVIAAKGLSAVIARTTLAAFSMLSSRAGDLRVFSRVSEGMTHANGVLTAEGKPLTQAEVDEVLAFIG